jgi:hypothetical protein
VATRDMRIEQEASTRRCYPARIFSSHRTLAVSLSARYLSP